VVVSLCEKYGRYPFAAPDPVSALVAARDAKVTVPDFSFA
jgi:hypothetical protein